MGPIITAVEDQLSWRVYLHHLAGPCSKTFREGLRKFDCRERREKFVDGTGHFVDQSIKKGSEGGGGGKFPQNDYEGGKVYSDRSSK